MMPTSHTNGTHLAADPRFPTVAAEDDVKRSLQFAGSPYPQEDIAVKGVPANYEISREDLMRTIKAVCFWQNVAVSSMLCIGGGMTFLLGELLFRERGGISVVSVVAHGLLLDICLNFFKGNLSSEWLEDSLWGNSRAVKEAASKAQQAILQIAILHDALLSATNPVVTLKVVAFLWLLTSIAPALGMWRLLACTYLGAFAWGATHTFASESLGSIYNRSTAALQEKVSALGLRRLHKGVILAASFLVLLYFSTWRTRLLTCFMGLVIVRCNLKSSEAKAFATTANETCAPYVRSARKQARRLSLAATDFVRRSGGGGKPHVR